MSTFGIGKLGAGVAGATALVALVAGCASSSSSGGSPSTGSSSPSGQQSAAAAGSGGALKSASTSIGTVLVDASGRTVYELVGDTAAKQTCSGACLAIWPAVMSKGTQVVVNGHPAFTYVGDTAAGQTKGQNLKDQWGLWVALDAKGNPVGGSASATSKAPASKSHSTKSKAPGGGGPAF